MMLGARRSSHPLISWEPGMLSIQDCPFKEKDTQTVFTEGWELEVLTFDIYWARPYQVPTTRTGDSL